MRLTFRQAIDLMRRQDPQKQEDAFSYLRDHASNHVEDLMTEFQRESDHGLRCWLLELVGHARSPRALPLLTEQLHGSDQALRAWAVAGLQRLATREARRVLYQACANGQIG